MWLQFHFMVKHIMYLGGGCLKSWKEGLCSLGGRVILIDVYLSSIPLHYMSLFWILVGVAESIEAKMSRFLWEGGDEERRDHLVKREVCCQSKCSGGLDIKNLRSKNVYLLEKWLWCFPCEPNSLWHKVINGIHGSDRDSLDVLAGRSTIHWSPWKAISQIHPLLTTLIQL